MATLDEDSERSNDFLSELDSDLARMSEAAMSVLDSITDEVNAMEKKSKSPKNTKSPSLGEHFDSSTQNDRSFAVTPSPDGKSRYIPHIDDIEVSDDEDDASLDLSIDASLDDSITRELDALRSVTRQIERELSTQDGNTMEQAIAEDDKSLDPKNRILTSDDREIIRRALDDEMKKYVPKNAYERFMKRYQLEGFSEQDKTYALVGFCTMVWSIVFRLLYKVSYGEI